MAKGSGNTRSSGPQSQGANVEVDPRAGFKAAESSLKYTYQSDNVKFTDVVLDLGNFTDADLGERDTFRVTYQTRNDAGKFVLGDGYFQFNKTTTLRQIIRDVVKEAKDAYRYNDGDWAQKDALYEVDGENDKYAVNVTTQLTADNRVKIVVSRFKF